jgi:hypothetical protein
MGTPTIRFRRKEGFAALKSIDPFAGMNSKILVTVPAHALPDPANRRRSIEETVAFCAFPDEHWKTSPGVTLLVSPASSQIAFVASAMKSTSEPPHDSTNSSFKVVHSLI